MMTTESFWKELIADIKAVVTVDKILLFGSYAYGDPDVSSDIDLCIITRDKRRKLEIIRDIQKSLYKTRDTSFDILIYNPVEFENRADSITAMESTIKTRGKILYG